jgi:hypothetical protein
MGSVRARFVLPLVILACAFAATWVLVASARAEEGTTKEENPPAGEAVTEPVHQPVKETVEAAAAPEKVATVTAEPTTSPQTTTTSEAPGAASSGSSGAASSTPATTPKSSNGSTATSTSTTHGGDGGNAGGGVHHAGQLAGSTGSQGSTDNSSAGGGSQGELEVAGTYATSGSESLAVTPTEAGEPADHAHAGSPTDNATEAHGGADPRSAVNLDEARPVETAPKPKASPSPLAAVGRVISRPFKEGASLPAVPLGLLILLAAAAITWFFWFDWESPSRGAAGVDGGEKEVPEE